MKKSKILIYTIVVLVALAMVTGLALAEDGYMFRRNVSKTPDLETEKAAIYMMDFYVPAQRSDGTVAPVDNFCAYGTKYVVNEDTGVGMCERQVGDESPEDPTLLPPRNYAKPLVSVYIDGEPMHTAHEETDGSVSTAGGIVLGAIDAYVGISLDDGITWRTENLSRSADLSSFTGTAYGINQGIPYPGGVHALVHQVAEDKILAVWASKYCQSGFPLYSLDLDPDAAVADYFSDLETNYGKNAMYLYDLFGVSGAQGSVDYTAEGWPEVGEVPYSCIWTARGKLLPGDDPNTDTLEASHVVWMAPERLTSGVRDANLPAVDCAKNAGCALTWQEDPAGLRPGKGLGPGEGWSGAIANAKTDIWYSYITFADFDWVFPKDTDREYLPEDPVLIEEYEAALDLASGDQMDRPKPYVPMAMPVRLTDNDMCKGVVSLKNPEDPFCWLDFDTINDETIKTIKDRLDGLTEPEDDAEFCASTEDWINPGGTTLPICVTEDGRWMIGRVASTRVRMVIKPYTPAGAPDHDGDGVPDASAWLSLAAEETKALGITAEVEGITYDPIDIGKDMFYYSFDYAKPYNLHVNSALDTEDGSAYIVQQGGMLNQPAKCSPWFITTTDTNPDATCPADGEFFDIQIDPITKYEYYLTEIARRFALTLNNIPNITNTEINESGLAGMLIYKQGIIWQGGPADIMLRRLIVPDDFDPTVDNPFAYENMDCTNPDGTSGWVYPEDITGGYEVNPYYLKGLCMAPAINISGTTIVSCDAGIDNDTCAAAFPVADDGTIPADDDPDDTKFPKVRVWRQLPYDGTATSKDADGKTIPVTITGDPNDDNDLDDQTWENPYDVAKGHRGFLYGDYVMMMYAWSPNWKSNTVGNDHYNLYQRRSFDGGLTWRTTPTDLGGDGTDYLEYYYSDDKTGEYVPVLWSYGAGDLEQARNLSLLTGNKITILDPRYSPPGGLKQYATIRTDWLEDNADLIAYSFEDALPYPDDAAIDPSKYYMVYETGDNTTVAVGEAIPLNLYYSRATNYGDDYEFYDYLNDGDDCNPLDDGVVDWATCIEPRWPWLENAKDDLSGEASVVMNPGGTFAYNVWNQWREEILPDGTEHVYDSDMIYRRMLWLPDDYDVSVIERAPYAFIIYISQTTVNVGEEVTITFVGSGKDWSGTGIQGYKWALGDPSVKVGSEQRFTLPTSALAVGKHTIFFSVEDGNGKWSRPVPAEIEVIDPTEPPLPVVNRIFIPALKH